MLDPVQSTSTAYDLSCDGTTILIDAICGWGFFPFMNIFLWHAMDVVIPVSNCRHGGLVTRHHNEVWDVLGDLASPAYKDAVKEPIVCECEGDGMALIADFGVKGMWQPQVEALFDIRVTDTDAPSYVAESVSSILAAAEEEKKMKYRAGVEACHASLTPFVKL